MEEKDLFFPIKKLLEEKGFTVKGEINYIDILALKDEMMLAVELKLKISLKLIYQAIERFKICEKVYLGIPNEAIKSHQKHMKSLILLLKRLNIGLIVVKDLKATVLLDPFDYDVIKSRQRNQKKKIKAINEFKLREDKNVMGGSKGLRMTLYREQVIKVAQFLKIHQIATPKMIKNETQIDKVSSILQKNYYGWFERVERGKYKLSSVGIKYLCEFNDRQ